MASLEIEKGYKCPKCGNETLECGMNYNEWMEWNHCESCGYDVEGYYDDEHGPFEPAEVKIINEGVKVGV